MCTVAYAVHYKKGFTLNTDLKSTIIKYKSDSIQKNEFF